MENLYIGLMSGTSVDGIDTALVNFDENQPALVDYLYTPFQANLRHNILSLCSPGQNEIERFGEVDVLLGKAFAEAVNRLLSKAGLNAKHIRAIGSHGQTIRHAPNHSARFSLQIGDPNIIAACTGITTVADFRRKDLALGGQGAPLVPAFHHDLFATHETDRAIVNIGGIANITLLNKQAGEPVLGFDTGPGNVLLDAWVQKHRNQQYDHDGTWALAGKVNDALLRLLLQDAYFKLTYPKSTGREYFNLNWLEQQLAHFNSPVSAVDVQATLLALTAKSICSPIKDHFCSAEILICGGGANNKALIDCITSLSTPSFSVATTQKYQIPPDWIEAMAFAWLAKRTMHRQSGNLPSVTGASASAVLGAIYHG